MNIAIVDYGMGNLNSVSRKISRLNATPLITSDPKIIASSDKIILPGVGHFEKAMHNIRSLQLEEVLNEAVLVKNKPILGICLGMQLMASKSQEGNTTGMGWIDAEVKRFDVSDKLTYKVPHIGWNTVSIDKSSEIMNGLDEDCSFYFVHSYFMEAKNDEDVINRTTYATEFTSGVQKKNICGVQYHPEKSHDVGDRLFQNFLEL